MKNDYELYKKAFDLIEESKKEILEKANFGELRSQVSSLSVGMIMCNPLDYYKTDLESKKSVQNVGNKRCTTEIIMDIVKQMIKLDGRDDLLDYMEGKNLSNIAELVFKKDAQKYFTMLKNTINLETIERGEDGEQ